jgi:protease secretion system membrane fusion protein
MNNIQASAANNATANSIAGIEAQNRGIEIVVSEKQKQLGYANQQLAGLAELSKEDLIPKTKLWDSQREVAQLRASIAEDLASIQKNKKQMSELAERKSAYQFDLDNTQIKSPVDGHVVGLTQFTNGGVITPGTHLMDIVPLNDDLVIEAQVPVNLIDKVKVNLDAEILFTAFNQNRTPHIPAKIVMVSPDKYVDEKTGLPFFKVRAIVTEKGQKLLKDHQVRSGMPAELFIKTGERSLMSYLLKPFFDRSYSAFREE